MSPLRSLWVRLITAFVGVTLLAMILVAVLTDSLAGNDFQQYLQQRDQLSQSGLLEALGSYYDQVGSWRGVQFMLGMGRRNPIGPLRPRDNNSGPANPFPGGMIGSGAGFVLADDQYNIILDPRPGGAEGSLTEEERANALAIASAASHTVGYLLVLPRDGFLPVENAFLQGLRGTLLVAALIAGGIAIIAGILISRMLSAPLARLAGTARAFSTQRWEQRVPRSGIHEIDDAGQALNTMADELQRGESLRRNMIADIAHELRTPLTVMQGNLRAMLDGIYPLEASEIATLFEETQLLSRLVNDLHELSLADAGQLPLNLQAIDCRDALRLAASRFAATAEEQGVVLHFSAEDSLPLVRADPDRLAQVLNNLLGNALRHSQSGTVSLAAIRSGAMIRLEVRDQGEGIAPDELPNIFERFYRGDRSRARSSGGAGLGLAIARAWTVAMGGQIGVESEQDRGTCFWFTLPAAS